MVIPDDVASGEEQPSDLLRELRGNVGAATQRNRERLHKDIVNLIKRNTATNEPSNTVIMRSVQALEDAIDVTGTALLSAASHPVLEVSGYHVTVTRAVVDDAANLGRLEHSGVAGMAEEAASARTGVFIVSVERCSRSAGLSPGPTASLWHFAARTSGRATGRWSAEWS